MKLEIQAIGNPNFPRFIIANNDGEVFDGTGWNKDRNQALVYTEGQGVAQVFRALEEGQYEHLPLREFTVTMKVRVRAAGPFTKAELEDFLEKAVSIFIDQGKAAGPFEDGLVQLAVTWNRMKEKAVAKEKDQR